MAGLDGETMSKSLGNQVLVSQLLRQGAERVALSRKEATDGAAVLSALHRALSRDLDPIGHP